MSSPTFNVGDYIEWRSDFKPHRKRCGIVREIHTGELGSSTLVARGFIPGKYPIGRLYNVRVLDARDLKLTDARPKPGWWEK